MKPLIAALLILSFLPFQELSQGAERRFRPFQRLREAIQTRRAERMNFQMTTVESTVESTVQTTIVETSTLAPCADGTCKPAMQMDCPCTSATDSQCICKDGTCVCMNAQPAVQVTQPVQVQSSSCADGSCGVQQSFGRFRLFRR